MRQKLYYEKHESENKMQSSETPCGTTQGIAFQKKFTCNPGPIAAI